MNTLSSLETLLAGKKAPIEKLYNEIEVLSKLTVAQEIFFVYDVSSILKYIFISKLDKYNIWLHIIV